jgi:hypothetical protein
MYKLAYSYLGESHEIGFENYADAIRFYDALFLDLSNEFLTLTENDRIIACTGSDL